MRRLKWLWNDNFFPLLENVTKKNHQDNNVTGFNPPISGDKLAIRFELVEKMTAIWYFPVADVVIQLKLIKEINIYIREHDWNSFNT